MGRVMREESDMKFKLVTEICNISKRAIACAHWHGGGNRNRSPFIDWCLILGVEENAGLDVIRKQYHKLALQLHPDKNTHPKAEVAFKLVSEAYECLSQKAKRAEFNLEKRSNPCIECNRTTYPTSNPPAASGKTSATRKTTEGVKALRIRFSEELRVIENCLRTTKASSRKEHPVFNPSDYIFHGYPHRRKEIHRSWLRAEELSSGRQRRCDSPVFELRSQT